MTKFFDGKKIQYIVQNTEGTSQWAQNSAKWLESGGLAKTENGYHKNRREAREHSSSSAHLEIQIKPRKSGVAQWNRMKEQQQEQQVKHRQWMGIENWGWHHRNTFASSGV